MTNGKLPLSLQLYTLRDEVKKDVRNALRRVAAIGYLGVEPTGFGGLPPREFRQMVEDLGMVIPSTHGPWALPDNLPQVIDLCGILGVAMVTGGHGPDAYRDLDSIKRTAEITERMNETLAAAGIMLTLHNHAWEFEKIDGRVKYQIFAELCPSVNFELDTYWAANFGENDATEMVRYFAARAPLLHIKDGPLIRPPAADDPANDPIDILYGPSACLLPVGSGNNNIKGIVEALDPSVTRWLIVEQDNCEGDCFECVEKSYRFLVNNGLGRGAI